MILFDMEDNSWLFCSIKYPNMDKPIVARAKHTMTTLNNYGIDQYYEFRWQRQLWYNNKMQKNFNVEEFKLTNKSGFKYGFFLFGGYANKTEEALGDLWLI